MTYLTTRRPVRNLFSLHNEMGRIFGDLFVPHEGRTDTEETSWMPTVDKNSLKRKTGTKSEPNFRVFPRTMSMFP